MPKQQREGSRRFQTLAHGRGIQQADMARLTSAARHEENRWRRARSVGIIGTVLLHFLLLLLFRGVTVPPYVPQTAAGPPMGDIRAAAGGSGLTMVEVRVQRTPVEERVEPIIPVPEEVVPEEEVTPPAETPAPPSPMPSQPGSSAPGQGGDDGRDAGPASGAGEGQGGGGSGDEGSSRIIPPSPRGIFIPPAGRPNSARGLVITVSVVVTETGQVERNSVSLAPPTSDSGYNQRLIRSVSDWRFEPARQAGRPIAVRYSFEIEL